MIRLSILIWGRSSLGGDHGKKMIIIGVNHEEGQAVKQWKLLSTMKLVNNARREL